MKNAKNETFKEKMFKLCATLITGKTCLIFTCLEYLKKQQLVALTVFSLNGYLTNEDFSINEKAIG